MEQRARVEKDEYYHHPPDEDDLKYAAYMSAAYADTIEKSNQIGRELGMMYAADTPVSTPIIPTVTVTPLDPKKRLYCANAYAKAIAHRIDTGTSDMHLLYTEDHECARYYDQFVKEQQYPSTPATCPRFECAVLYSRMITSAVNSGITDFGVLFTANNACASYYNQFIHEQPRRRRV